MKIALHQDFSSFFNDWKLYCAENSINYKIVNCYDSDIIYQLADCDVLMWHHNHANPKDALFAKQLLYSLEQSGKKVFPDFNTGWHFDDKVGQKYLMEAMNIPHVQSYVFYSKIEAMGWIEHVAFPKVFKLRRGAGGRNVRLVNNKKDAMVLINQAFGSGFRQYDVRGGIKEGLRKWKNNKGSIYDIFKAFAHFFIPIQLEKSQGREKGYIYFQDFVPNNDFDIRVIVVKNKAYGMKRKVRKGDFRASGSSEFIYDPIDKRILEIAFNTVRDLGMQCCAFDFIYDINNDPLIIEMSYGFGTLGSGKCDGYYEVNFDFIKGPFNPFGWMIEDIISSKFLKKL